MATLTRTAGEHPDGIEESLTYFERVPDSPDAQFGVDTSRIVRKYDIAGQDLAKAVRLLLGFSKKKFLIQGNTQFNYISRLTPHEDPEFAKFYATQISRVEGVGKAERPGGYTIYPLYRLTVVYNQLTYNVRSDVQTRGDLASLGANVDPGYPHEGTALARNVDRYITRIAHPQPRFLTLNVGLMRYVDVDQKPIPEGLQVARPEQTIEVTWHEVPIDCIPMNFHLTALGGLNNLAFMGYAVQTLMCQQIKYRPRISPVGLRLYDVQYLFHYRPNFDRTQNPIIPLGWNYVERVKDGVLRPVQVSSNGLVGGTPPYHSINYEQLFLPDSVTIGGFFN